MLLLSLLMWSTFFAPIAKLRKLNFALRFLLIFTAPVIRALALGAVEFYKSFL